MPQGAFVRFSRHHLPASSTSRSARGVKLTTSRSLTPGSAASRVPGPRDELTTVSFSQRFEKLGLGLRIELEGLVRLAREHRHQSTIWKRLSFDDDLPRYHSTRCDAHRQIVTAPGLASVPQRDRVKPRGAKERRHLAGRFAGFQPAALASNRPAGSSALPSPKLLTAARATWRHTRETVSMPPTAAEARAR